MPGKTIEAGNRIDQFDYFYQLGQYYFQSHEWNASIMVLNRALELQPTHQDAQLLLAYALLLGYKSKQDLLEGERLFQQVLQTVPTYTDATEGLKKVKTLLLKRERDKQSTAKKETWVESYLTLAKEFTRQGNYGAVVEIYLVLAKAFPKNAEYLFELGLTYNRMEQHCEAITAFEQALDLKPDYSDALIALGNQYLFFKDFETSNQLFSLAAHAAPQDPDAWLGLARTEALLGHPTYADSLYRAASAINPDYVDIQRSYANFLFEQRRYTEAESLYHHLTYRGNDLSAYRLILFDISGFTKPTFYTTASGTEEREKDFRTRRWITTLSYLNADAGVIYPLNDEYRVSLRGHTGYTKQKNLFSHTTLFDTKSDSLGLRGEWFYNPFWTFSLFANVEFISNHDEDATLRTKKRTLFEPSLSFRYTKDPYKVIFGEMTDTVIFKDFNKNKVLVIPRESLFVFYERRFGDYHLVGADATWLWYQDPIHNQEQDLSAWIQTGLPYFEELSARYHCVYRQFRHETTGYYSFQYQLTHWLKFHWLKRWSIGGRFELEYWHGWRTTRGKDPQEQIVIGPLPANLPVTTVHNQIDWIALTLGYTFTNNFDVNMMGSYYHDSFDYTVWSGRIGMEWRF